MTYDFKMLPVLSARFDIVTFPCPESVNIGNNLHVLWFMSYRIIPEPARAKPGARVTNSEIMCQFGLVWTFDF